MRLEPARVVVWESVRCPTCFAPEGLACKDGDGYRQPFCSHPARIEAFNAVPPLVVEVDEVTARLLGMEW